MSVRQFQNGPSSGNSGTQGLLVLVPAGLFGLALLAYGVRSGFSELKYDLYGKEAVGTIRATGASGPGAWLGGYEFVADGKTYTGVQQKMLREQPTVQYLSNDPATNRVEAGSWIPALNWLFVLLSIFGGGLLALIGITQIYVFVRFRKD